MPRVGAYMKWRQMLRDIQGHHTRVPSAKFIDRVIEINSSKTQSAATILKVASFEDTRLSDSAIFQEIGLDLQEYVKTMYTEKSLATQRNLRATRKLCQMLGILDFSLFVMSPTGQGSRSGDDAPHGLPFKAIEDSKTWQECLAVQDQPLSQFARLALEHQRGTPYTGPSQKLTEETLEEAFHQVDIEFFSGLREERAGLISDLNRLRIEFKKAEDAAQAKENSLQALATQHNSLLQHLNVRDNTELSDLVHQFRSLNEDIDGLSLGIAQIIPDKHFEQHPDCAKCYNPPGLRQWLSGSERSLPSLLKSRTGVPMGTRQFLELLSASIICQSLCLHVFQPFYPTSPSNQKGFDQTKVFTSVYKDLRLHGQQIATAKWRIDAYSSLVKLDSARDKFVAETSSYIATYINTAVVHLFGVEIADLSGYFRLTQLVTRALELNHRIKAEVAHAGDIHVEYFYLDQEYDDLRMTVLDYKKGDRLPSHIVCTCGLGVSLTKAVGEGRMPESTVLLKAVVASEQVYD
ncbi:hypothetical protein FRC07_005169 [Ceratobasidium sp. 392]|nr:hypothetical protein FRC07_005169 [Ceratobasidium sp. 392]